MNTMTLTNKFVVVSHDAGAGATATAQQGDAGPLAVADYTLSGIVIKLVVEPGSRRVFTYVFRFTIT